MESIKDQVNKLKPPKPREVWRVLNKNVTLHETDKNKRFRYVLILASSESTNLDASIINVVPLTTVRKFDKLIFPVFRAYENCYHNFKPDKKSAVLIQFFQPIRIEHFYDIYGIIDKISYEAIKNLLCTEVIGYYEFDLSIE
ncbi:MAG: hypothetical protein KAT74_02070 [Candidatus Cloacimonetes bacterium]|nr:hypothetical protein [Candidatus Cloacimonadota bacterium]